MVSKTGTEIIENINSLEVDALRVEEKRLVINGFTGERIGMQKVTEKSHLRWIHESQPECKSLESSLVTDAL